MKRILTILCIVVLSICLCAPVAAQPLDPERECTLTLQHSKDGVAFAGVKVDLFRVAEAFSDGTYAKIAPFTEYAVSIHGLTEAKEWSALASTLYGYVQADAIAPTTTATTDATGSVTVTGLATGLYLVGGATYEHETGAYTFDPFMLYLPTQTDGVYEYDVVAKPKADHFTPTPGETEYRVIKLWKDTGYTDHRPTSIEVELLKDGTPWKTVMLNEDNNWSYRWTATEGVWSVSESNVPEGYTVTSTREQTVFRLTNTYTPDQPSPPEKPPQTGDTAPIWLYVLVMCLSGLGLVIVALALLRGKRHEKHQ